MKLFDKPVKRKASVKKTSIRIPYTAEDIYNLPDHKLTWLLSNGSPSEQLHAENTLTRRKRLHLAKYGC